MVDTNVGKLVRWLRMMGYDSRFFDGNDDWQMIITALNEGRVILTRDTGIMKRGVVASGRLKAVLIDSQQPEEQLRQVLKTLNLDCLFHPFTICLECNQALEERTKEQVRERVPHHVFQTQSQYQECPACQRIYWRGSHWQVMTRSLEKFGNS